MTRPLPLVVMLLVVGGPAGAEPSSQTVRQSGPSEVDLDGDGRMDVVTLAFTGPDTLRLTVASTDGAPRTADVGPLIGGARVDAELHLSTAAETGVPLARVCVPRADAGQGDGCHYFAARGDEVVEVLRHHNWADSPYYTNTTATFEPATKRVVLETTKVNHEEGTEVTEREARVWNGAAFAVASSRPLLRGGPATWVVFRCAQDHCSAELLDDATAAAVREVVGDGAPERIPPPWSTTESAAPDRTEALAAAVGIPAELRLWTFPDADDGHGWWTTPTEPSTLPSLLVQRLRVDPVWRGGTVVGARVWLKNRRFSSVAVSNLETTKTAVTGVAQAPNRSLDHSCASRDMPPVPLGRPHAHGPKCTRLPLPGGQELRGSAYLVGEGDGMELCAVHTVAGHALTSVCRPWPADEHAVDAFTSGQLGHGTSSGLIEAWFEADGRRWAVLNVHNPVHQSRCVVPFPSGAMPAPDPERCSVSGFFHGWP